MAVEIEGLEFQIEAKAEGSTSGIDKLAESFKKLKSALGGDKSGIGKRMNELNDALGKIQSSVSKIDALGNAVEKLSNAKISTTVEKRIRGIGEALDSITLSSVENLEDIASALERISAVGNIPNLRGLASGVNNAGSVTGDTTGSGAQDSDVEDVQSTVQTVETATNSLGVLKKVMGEIGGITGITYPFTQLKSALTDLPNKITQTMGRLREMYAEFKKSGGILGFFGRTVAAVSKNLGSKLAAGVKAVTSAMGNKFSSKIKQTTGALGGFLASIKRIAMYRLIRSFFSALTQSMKEGMNNLYEYSSLMGGTFKGSMDRIATSFQYLKNSMGAVVAPLINALAPAIDFVIDKFVSLLNVIGMLFAKLSGATVYTAAKKVSTEYKGAADSASSAAKEMKKSIMGFDEINKLTDNSSGGDGGGSSTPDYGSMFEQVPIDSEIGAFAEKLKEAFMSQDWQALGTLLGDKFNEIVNAVPWETIGSAIGTGINGAVQTAYYFLKTADFNNLGQKVASMINAALEQIDGEYIGRLMIRGITAGLDFLIGGLGGLNWGLIGKTVGDAIKGAFNEAQEWIAGIDWSGMAHSFYTNLKDFLTNVDFSGIASSFFKLLGSALGAAVSFIATFVSDIWSDITGYFSDYLTNDDGTKKCGLDWVAGILEGIWDGIKNIGTWIYENVFQPFIDGFKEAFGIHSPSTVMAEQGGYIIEGLFNGIKDAIKNIKQWIKKNILEPIKKAFEQIGATLELGVELIKEGWESIKSWVGDKVSVAISLFKRGWSTIANFVTTAVTVAISLAKQGWETLRSWVGEIGSKAFALAKDGWSTVSNYVGNIGSKAFALAKDGWSTVSNFVGNIGSKAFALAKDGWSTVSNYVGNIGSKAFALAKDGWSTVSNYVGSIGNKAFSLAKSGWTTVSAYVGNIDNKAFSLAKSGWTSLSSWVGNIGSKAVSLTKSGWTSLSSWVGSSVSAAIKLYKSGWSSIGSFVGTSVSVGISLFKSGWSSIKSFFGLSSGGTVGAKGGVKFFAADGGVFGANGFVSGIPAYAGGTAKAHGSMFVAGERGAEVVGHLNGHTEVLNRSQMASTMFTAMVAGMQVFSRSWDSINRTLVSCTNGVITTLYDALDKAAIASYGRNYNTVNHAQADWVANSAFNYNSGTGSYSADQVAEGVREGMYEANARQNELLREQNELLRQLLAKDTTVEVTTSSFTRAASRKNQRDGRTVIPVSV